MGITKGFSGNTLRSRSSRRRGRTLPLGPALLAVAVFFALCAFPLLSGPHDLGPETSSPVLGMFEADVAFAGEAPAAGAVVTIQLNPPQGDPIPIVAQARVIGPDKVLVPFVDTLLLKEVQNLGQLTSRPFSPNGAPVVVVKDVPRLKKLLEAHPAPETPSVPEVEGAEKIGDDESRIWVLGEPRLYLIRPDGSIKVMDTPGA